MERQAGWWEAATRCGSSVGQSNPAYGMSKAGGHGPYVALAGVLAFWRFATGGRSPSRGQDGRMHESRAPARGPAQDDLSPDAGADGRGRNADTPSDIPAPGWKDILWRIWENLGDHRLLAIAAGVTFYALLAIFPAIAALVSLYGLFADPGTIGKNLNDLASFMPGGATEVISDQINRLTSQGAGKLGVTFVVSLAISLWSANAGMKAIFDALNVVYAEHEKRSFFKLNLISLSFTAAAILILILAIASVAVVPAIVSFFGLSGASWVVTLIRWPLMIAVVALLLACLYRWGPSREEAKWRWITWGSAFASVVWLGSSLLFSWYVSNFGSYNKTYGSLGAVIGFMTWIWLSVIVKLVGAELDAEMEHQTARDTTTGGGKPMGARGARMADTVGPAKS